MLIVLTYPFESPNKRRMRKYVRSEFISGAGEVSVREEGREEREGREGRGRETLHARKSGMKSVRASERSMIRRGCQMRYCGYEQMYRPSQSAMLKSRKWKDTNRTGEKKLMVESLCTERIVLVIGG